MAKFENELDIKYAKTAVSKKKEEIEKFISEDKDLQKIIDILEKNNKIYCYIFSKSVAFRIGKSSIKSISGFSSGFKTSFGGNKQAKDVFTSTFKIGKSKNDKVLIAAAYFLINNSDRTRSESDKTEAVESEQVMRTKSMLTKLIEEHGTIRLKIGDEVYEIDDFEQVSGRPKADMVFIRNKKNVVFVSHKKGGKPADFQQYGGFSGDLNIRERSDIERHELIRKFVLDIESIFEAFQLSRDTSGRYDFNNLQKGCNFARILDDSTMAYTVMFGKDYSTNKVGLDNCSILIDGDIVFKSTKGSAPNVFELEGSYHTTINPTLVKRKPHFTANPDDVYTPVMFIIKSEQQGLNQGGFSNARAVIWPNNKVVQAYSKKLDDVLNAVKSNDTSKIEALKKEMVK